MSDRDGHHELTDELTTELGTAPPESVLALPVASRQALARLVREARAREEEQADRDVERALRGVPLPVRGLVRKALVG